MRKTFGMNRGQKAAYKPGERRTSREEIAEMLVLSVSEDVEDRLCAAEHLCPCHVRTRIPEVWDALFRMLEDSNFRVRQQAWHTLEDGGKPTDETAFDFLIRVMQNEPDAKVKRFAELTLKKIGLESREQVEDAKLWLAARPALRQRGKCDFCSASNIFVEVERDTLIPVPGAMSRSALICDNCAKNG